MFILLLAIVTNIIYFPTTNELGEHSYYLFAFINNYHNKIF